MKYAGSSRGWDGGLVVHRRLCGRILRQLLARSRWRRRGARGVTRKTFVDGGPERRAQYLHRALLNCLQPGSRYCTEYVLYCTCAVLLLAWRMEHCTVCTSVFPQCILFANMIDKVPEAEHKWANSGALGSHSWLSDIRVFQRFSYVSKQTLLKTLTSFNGAILLHTSISAYLYCTSTTDNVRFRLL